jgi:hypothetical protein
MYLLYTFFRFPLVIYQTQYQSLDPPNSSAVDFVPHATSVSSRHIALFDSKLTSLLPFFFFFRLHHHPRCKHFNSCSPSDSLVPNIGCPGPSILFICPFVLGWETVVDRSPLSFQFFRYRQHCAVLNLSLRGILFHSFPFGLIARLDYFVGLYRFNY